MRQTLLPLALLLASTASAQPRPAPASAPAKPTPAAAAPAAPEVPFTKTRLGNGLEVIYHEDHRLPLVAVNLWYHVGAINERPGRSGFAHLFEHMMFQGSAHVGDDQHFAILESIGASGVNGTTDFDRTNYFEGAPKNHLETLLWLESDRMGFLLDTLTQEKLDRQKEVVRNERRQTTENTPYGRADERVFQLLFPSPHPYFGAVIGSHADLEAATLADVRDFFATYYTPANATLVVAGDFEPRAAAALVDKYFGELAGGPRPAAPEVAPPPPPAREIREAMTDDVQLARLTFAWVVAPVYSEGEAELEELGQILGADKSSRLYKRLVYETKLAQQVTCWMQSLVAGSVLACDVTARPGTDLVALEKAFDAELAALRGKGPTADELLRVKTKIRANALRLLQRVLGRADLLNAYNHYLGDPGYFARDLARYAAVTPESARAAAQRWLDPARRVVIVVTPKEVRP